MPVITVASPKGLGGKSTLAINVAGWFAHGPHAVMLGRPVLGHLHDTQNYVQLAARGLTLWDSAPRRVERERERWQVLIAGADR